jgi:hypothetical protein
MAGRQQTASPQQRRSKDATAHPHQPGARPEPPHPDPAHSRRHHPAKAEVKFPLRNYFRPCRTRARTFLGRLRAKYVTKGFLMLKPGLARLPARVHASKQRFLAGRFQ